MREGIEVPEELIDALVCGLIEDTRDDDGAVRFVYLKERGLIVDIETCTDLDLMNAATEQLQHELDEVNRQLQKLECLKRHLQK